MTGILQDNSVVFFCASALGVSRVTLEFAGPVLA